MYFGKQTGIFLAAAALLISLFLGGCGSQEEPQAGKAQVKAMKVLQQDTPVAYNYPGHLQGKEEVRAEIGEIDGSWFEAITDMAEAEAKARMEAEN